MNYLIFTQYDRIYSVPHQVFRTLKEAKEALKTEARNNLANIPKHSFNALVKNDKAFGIACFNRECKQERLYTFSELLF
jgi:hypothetical protein